MRQRLWFCILFLSLAVLFGECLGDDDLKSDLSGGRSMMRLSDLEDGEETCRDCPIGTYSGSYIEGGKEVNCSEVCPLGSCPAAVNCTACPIGTYNDEINASMCHQCEIGYVAKTPGTVNCTECPPGSGSNEENTACVSCIPGDYNPDYAGICIPCEPGSHSTDPGSMSCDPCSEGTYNPTFGQSSCFACGIGKYNPETGQKDISSCLVCPTGYFCPYVATNEPQPCPADYYCKAGSIQPVACQSLFESEPTSESCQPKPTLYLLMLAGIVAVVVVIGVIVCVRNNRKKTPARNFSDAHRLIPEPKDGPVYGGL